MERKRESFFPWERLFVGDCTEVSHKRGKKQQETVEKNKEKLAGLPSRCCFVKTSLRTDV